jgi:type I restriction enzyme S subunit
MKVKPGYKQTEVGVIPEDWDVKPTSKFAYPVRGGSPRPAGDPRYFDGSYIPWLTVAGLTNIPAGQITVTATESCLTEEGALHSRTLLPGTLMIANSGATLGVAKILGIECCANDGIAALLDLSNNVSPLYVAHYINSKTSYLREVVATGNGQPNLNTELIGAFRVPLPPTKAEQEAIAEALSDADALIESLEQLIAKKRNVKQGAMQELLTGKRRLPGFSGKWEVKPLGDLFHFSGGFSASRDQLSTDGYCYLHYGDIHTSSKTYIDVGSEFQAIPKLNIPLNRVSAASILEDGDVVFVDASEDDAGTSRHVVIVNKNRIPYISGLHTIVAKGKTGELDHTYCRYCFQTAEIRSQILFFAVGTKVSGISKTNIVKVTLPVPPKSEQFSIGVILSDMDAEITTLETKLAKARQIKQGMMQELLTGRIRLI